MTGYGSILVEKNPYDYTKVVNSSVFWSTAVDVVQYFTFLPFF
jgi:hypothetical protein